MISRQRSRYWYSSVFGKEVVVSGADWVVGSAAGTLCVTVIVAGGGGLVSFGKIRQIGVLKLCKWKMETRGCRRKTRDATGPATRFDFTMIDLWQWRNHVPLFHFGW